MPFFYKYREEFCLYSIPKPLFVYSLTQKIGQNPTFFTILRKLFSFLRVINYLF